jgi:NADH-quinone oxidoreductase subunit L
MHRPEPWAKGSLSVTLITLLLFLGATGKSAQVPLYVWLPDAMEGPTPVSALIHAATMVTAGLYLVAKLSFLFILAPFTLTIIAVLGTVTASLRSDGCPDPDRYQEGARLLNC